MFPLRTLLIAALPLLALSSIPEQCSFETSTHHSSPILKSLQCYNDFTTQIRCTWEEEPDTHLHMPISNGKPCIPESHDNLMSSGKLIQSCVYKTEVFGMGNHEFFFNTSCPPKVTTLHIATQGNVLPPTNFSEKKDSGDNRLLSWSSPYPPSSQLSLKLTYQLKYRRHAHEWIVVNDINVTKFVIKSQKLFPGYSYEAMVRARSPEGLWSDWTPKVVWMTEEEGVLNLQCVIKEGEVMCSWQVMKWQAKFLSFHLCGRTNRTKLKCNHCAGHTEHPHSRNLRHFTCSLYSSEPELLTVEIRSLHKIKAFSNPDNILPPPPSQFRADKKDGVWKLSWAQRNVNEKLILSYEVYIESNDKKNKVKFNLSEAVLSTNVPSSLWPSTKYMAMVRAIPSRSFAGRPSDWSDPTYFTTDPAPWINTIIYVLIAVLVAVLFIILYNALPACHRRLVLWNISIPSPINSKVLEGMSNKKFPPGEANLYTGSEKTSVFVIQTSDDPIICKGSISEYPLLKCSDDIDMDLGMSKSGWPQGSSCSSLFVEGSKMTDKSCISFTGPYILCREDSSVPSETSDTFSSLLSFDEDGRYISESSKDSLPIKGGYVLSPSQNPTSECSTPITNLASENREPTRSELPDDDPPAYTPSSDVMSDAIFSHPSGYCLMPNMDTIAAWVSDSVPPPEGNTERKLHEIVSPERSYVTLSQQGL